MHPAYSVIVFTTASGLGYGLLVLLAIFAAFGLLPADPLLGLAAFGLAFAAITFGLLVSTFHLGHPERTLRAFSQWRTSWLSREGVAAVATYVPAGLFAIGWVFGGQNSGVWAALGLVGAALALATVWCTGMIYASLPTIRAWNSPMVAPTYIVLALASGSLWLAAIAHAFGIAYGGITHLPVALLILAWLLKAFYWRGLDQGTPASTAGTATGLGEAGARVRLLEMPHTQENYVCREMGYVIARRHAARMRGAAQVLAFLVPLALTEAATFLAPGAPLGAAAAFLAALAGTAGILLERWLFFAEARHVVTLYYGAEKA